MTKEEQNVFLNAEYTEAVRYLDNAKEALQKAKKDGSHYIDKKYVRTACGTAYLGVICNFKDFSASFMRTAIYFILKRYNVLVGGTPPEI